MKVIKNFDKDFNFLSNFSKHGFRDLSDGVWWKTNEHFYQAHKTVNMVDKGRIWSATSPGEARGLGGGVELRKDWNNIKNQVMMLGLQMKFDQNEDIRKILLSLAGYTLIEGNRWHDNYWGDCYCDGCKIIEGKNMLGKLLMFVRNRWIQNGGESYE